MNKHQNLPKISVIIPCYNQGQFLREAIGSVLRQTFRDFEIIIVDDGSTDASTSRALDEIKNRNPEIRVIHQPNGGPANARNNGIKASQGEFFLPLDSDDTIEPTMLEKCFGMLSKDKKLGFVYAYTHFFGTEDRIWENPRYNFYDLLWANQATVCALVRKNAWKDVEGYDGNKDNGYEDWEFFINLGEHNWFGKVLKESLFNYRKHGDSRMNFSELKHDTAVRYIREKHKDLYSRESLRKIKQTWKPQGEKYFQKFGSKLKATGIGDSALWRKHPFAALGRLIPVRIKRKINSLFGRRIFDTSYYRRSE